MQQKIKDFIESRIVIMIFLGLACGLAALWQNGIHIAVWPTFSVLTLLYIGASLPVFFWLFRESKKKSGWGRFAEKLKSRLAFLFIPGLMILGLYQIISWLLKEYSRKFRFFVKRATDSNTARS